MKKILALLLAVIMVLSLVACATTEKPADAAEYAVAMITDYGDITDQSFNQTTYEACKEFCEANGVKFNYFKPAGDNTADRVAMIEKAIDEDYNVIVMPATPSARPSRKLPPTTTTSPSSLWTLAPATSATTMSFPQTCTALSTRKSSAATWPATQL